ncbi:MAG TPA: acetoacetate--CoA ligase [Gammaproteobacteria bacterium]|nr:acetoacetate--CoA ligase [Gammaproteobacteria bacterium]
MAAEPEPIWTPSAQRAAASHLSAFMAARAPREVRDYRALHAWSIAEPAPFWSAVAEFTGVKLATRARSVVEDFDRFPGARWFEGAELSFTENLLPAGAQGTAIVSLGEQGERTELGWEDLRRQVGCLEAALASLGVGAGDRVAGLVPNAAPAVVAMLAAAGRGAIWSGCSPDFGTRAVLERFGQIEPKVLVAADGYVYRGKRISSLATVLEVAAAIPSLEAVIVFGRLDERPALDALANAGPKVLRFEDLTSGTASPSLTPYPFAHPLYILYSSGTTGAPKCIVHGAGGTLLQHRKEHLLHTDVGAGDVVFYFTTCGWMMWHWLVSALAGGSTVVLYDGAPLHPDPAALWRIAEREGITVFGTSASYLAALDKSGCAPCDEADLGALRTITSTGSPLAPASYDYVYGKIKRDVQLASISGGSDIISCFALGNPLLPVYRGELQCLGLGMDVRIFDEHGHAVRGQKGELVCASPFPSTPLGFWHDPGGERFHAAYFERFPGVWRHGDYAELTPRDGLIIYGRSDTVLNPGGVRIGTAEIYRVVESLPEVAECIAVGQEWQGDTRIVLFVRLREGCRLDAKLEQSIRTSLRRDASPKHVPAKILEVTDIPRTLNGKLVEAAVRDAVHGRPSPNLDALANPEALDQFRNRPELA